MAVIGSKISIYLGARLTMQEENNVTTRRLGNGGAQVQVGKKKESSCTTRLAAAQRRPPSKQRSRPQQPQNAKPLWAKDICYLHMVLSTSNYHSDPRVHLPLSAIAQGWGRF